MHQPNIWLHQCIHENSNTRRIGVYMRERHFDDDEELIMDIVWIITDKFRETILLVKKHDIEGRLVLIKKLYSLF